MRSIAAFVLAIATFATATDGFAANMLINADFDQASSMAGWTWIQVTDGGESVVCGTGAECGVMHFSNAECCGVASSGSVASNSSFFDAEALTQCVAGVVENTAYDFGAWIRLTTVPGTQPGLPGVNVRWYSSNDCSGTALAFNGTTVGPASWSRTAFPTNVAPSGSHSAQFLLLAGPTGDSGTSVGMEFDGAFFGPSGTVPVELQSFEID